MASNSVSPLVWVRQVKKSSSVQKAIKRLLWGLGLLCSLLCLVVHHLKIEEVQTGGFFLFLFLLFLFLTTCTRSRAAPFPVQGFLFIFCSSSSFWLYHLFPLKSPRKEKHVRLCGKGEKRMSGHLSHIPITRDGWYVVAQVRCMTLNPNREMHMEGGVNVN